MNGEDRLKTANRSLVLGSYTAAVSENFIRYSSGDRKATSEYIYDNQKEDAMAIVGEFYHKNRRVVSITKKTKVGADGLMIELAKQMTTHPDDDFVINPANVRILTGMSNAGWEKDMKDKAPYCFKDKIFHHGQLKHSDLRGLKNSLIIIDELDNGDKERQVLHNTLKAAGALDIQYLEENNVRFVFISATMIKELYELYRWGEHHCLYKMTIPDSYIGHTEFLERGIIQEFYSLNTETSATKWVQEDILDNYGSDFRIHIVRANQKTAITVQNACVQNGIDYRNHTSSDKIDETVLSDLFEGALTRHVVLIVKGFFRRANLIPNQWKLRIGATHELYTKIVDNNAQIQALPGRMTGYWRGVIESGHKTGPYRTSVKAVEEYDAVYNNPFGVNSYQAAGFKKNNGHVTTITPTLVTPKNVAGLVPVDLPSDSDSDTDDSGEFERGHEVFNTQAENEAYAKKCGAQRISSYDSNDAGFKMCSTTSRRVHSLDDILKFTRTSNKGSNLDKKLSDLKVGEFAYRRYVCYRDITDKSSECFVTIWVKRISAAEV